MMLEDTAFVFLRPTSMTVTVEYRIGFLPVVGLYGPAYIQNSQHKNCVGRLRIVPHSENAARELPTNAIGWGAVPAASDGMFVFKIVYEPQHEPRILSLRNLALAKDVTIELFVQQISGNTVAVLSCEMSEQYGVPSEYQVERGF